MNNQLKVLGVILSLASVIACQTPQRGLPGMNGPYIGQNPPGPTAELFAPGLVSTGLEEGVITFMPDGRECYWSILLSGFETILTSRLENGKWTEPEVAPFAGKYYDGWPAIQPDGKRMFFHSGRPLTDPVPGITATFNIWVVDRDGKGWSEPRILGAPVDGSENATCPSVTNDGTIYFSKRFSDDTEKICRSRLVDGAYRDLEVLPASVNPSKYNFHGAISPDESILIRPLYGRADAIGGEWNYYVSFRSGDDEWSELVNPGPAVNSVNCAGASSFSPDGKFLFFQARIPVKVTPALGRKHSLREMIDKEIKESSRGSADIYWIEAKIVETARPKK
jgi:hypothetical protein